MSTYDPKDPDGVQAKKIAAQLNDPAFAAFRNSPLSEIEQFIQERKAKNPAAWADFEAAYATHAKELAPPILSLDRNDEGYWLHVDAPNGLKADFLLAYPFGNRITGRVLKSALEAQKP